MHFPAPNQQSTDYNAADIMLDDHHYFSFANEFKYLGAIFAPNLVDSKDVSKRIDKAMGALMSMQKLFKDKAVTIKLRKRIYEATAVNLMPWGCESWALLEKDRKRLEVCHHRCLRKMLGITTYDVKDHHMSNKSVREQMEGAYTITQSMDLRRARWLEMLANMTSDRGPRKLLVAWTPTPRPTGRPQQTIRHTLKNTLKTLRLSTNLKEWIPVGRNRQEWARNAEQKLGLKPLSYKYIHRKC